MEKQHANEQWVNRVMGSLDGMQRVSASPGLYDRVMSRLQDEQRGRRSSSVIVLKRTAAVAAILLITINLFSIVHLSRKAITVPQPQDVYQVVSDDISSLTDDN